MIVGVVGVLGMFGLLDGVEVVLGWGGLFDVLGFCRIEFVCECVMVGCWGKVWVVVFGCVMLRCLIMLWLLFVFWLFKIVFCLVGEGNCVSLKLVEVDLRLFWRLLKLIEGRNLKDVLVMLVMLLDMLFLVLKEKREWLLEEEVLSIGVLMVGCLMELILVGLGGFRFSGFLE